MKKIFLIVFAFIASITLTTSCVKGSGSTTSNASDTEAVSPVDSTDTVAETPIDRVLTCEGEAVGGAHASIFIEDDNGEDHEFEYSEIDPDSIDTWEEGDEMVVTYIHNPNPEIGDSVISVRQK